MKEQTVVIYKKEYSKEEREAYKTLIDFIKLHIKYSSEIRRTNRICNKDPENRPSYKDIDQINKEYKDTPSFSLSDGSLASLDKSRHIREFYIAYAIFRGKTYEETLPTKTGKKYWPPSQKKIKEFIDFFNEKYQEYLGLYQLHNV